MRVILHVDMDAFFAAVEVLDNPRLRGLPVIVGGPSRRSVVAAASYEVRNYGVHSALPLVAALKRCPHATVVPVRHDRYAQVSEQVFAIFYRFTPLVEGLSVDEAFLDVTESQKLFGDGVAIATKIKAAIRDELHLTASAGVAPCKFVAKIASDLKKPDGLVEVKPDEVEAFLRPLAIEKMWGVGPVAAKRLHEAGFVTFGDLAAAPVSQIETLLGSWGVTVHELAKGHDDRPVIADRAAKSIGAENTFDRDLTERSAIERHLLGQCERVAHRLVVSGLRGRTVTIKLKDNLFKLRTVRLRLSEAVNDAGSIFKAVQQLLDRAKYSGWPVRLTGVAVSDLCHGEGQKSLFADQNLVRRSRLEQVVVAARERFGDDSVRRAATLEEDDLG
jgi:DNA polymerase-4